MLSHTQNFPQCKGFRSGEFRPVVGAQVELILSMPEIPALTLSTLRRDR